MPIRSLLVNTRRPLISYESATLPAELPTDIVDTLNGYSLDQLQHVARYVEEVAEDKARETHINTESDDDEIEGCQTNFRSTSRRRRRSQ
jgi:hypothetical protein